MAEHARALDVEALRSQFPALSQLVHGQPLVYLDNAATVQKPACVLEELLRCYTESCANVNRGAHTLGERATEGYERARSTVQRFLHAASSEELVFTSGCTAAINLVAHGWGDRHVRQGDEVIVTGLEHHSNLLPWRELCRRRGARLRSVPIDEQGRLDLEAYARLLGPRTRLVAVAHVSNVLGTLTPLRELAGLAHAAGARILVDGAQAVARTAVDVQALDCDFYAFSGHKLYGPFGIGVLWGRRELLESTEPVFTGGGMVEELSAERASYRPLPARLEAGTPDTAWASDGCDSLGQSRRDATPLLARVGPRIAQQHLDTDVVGTGRTMLGDPAQDGILVAPRDDRVEQSVAHLAKVLFGEAGAE